MNIALTREQVRRVDRLAIDRYGLVGLVLMENAGRNAATIIRDVYGERGSARICCGPGNNGGDGCVIARHLHNTGWSVRLMITDGPSRMTPDTKVNFSILEAMELPVHITADATAQQTWVRDTRDDDVLVDALLGTGFGGAVRSPTAELIDTMNQASRRALVAVDVPSGLDCDTGEPANAAIRADLTITFVAAKTGFGLKTAASYVGRVEVVDIGAPRTLIAEIASAGTSE